MRHSLEHLRSVQGEGDEATVSQPGNTTQAGALIVNADDFGRNRETTDRIVACAMCGSVSSTSAMVLMEDSQRAACLARERGIDCGLHLNFTAAYTMNSVSPSLVKHQGQIRRFLLRSTFAQILFHPGLVGSFQYVVAAQLEEYQRLYDKQPDRIDGHHHMHLCANVLFGELIPPGVIVRRSFSFLPGEKSWLNRAYRRWIDRRLARRYRLVDLMFSIEPFLRKGSLRRIVPLARHSVVELETHPVNPEEYRLLTSGELLDQLQGIEIMPSFAASMRKIRLAEAL